MALQFFLISLMKGHSEQRPNPTSMRFKFQYRKLRIFLSQSMLWPFIPVFSFPSLASLSKIKWKTIELLSIIKFRFNLQFVAWKKETNTAEENEKKSIYLFFQPHSTLIVVSYMSPHSTELFLLLLYPLSTSILSYRFLYAYTSYIQFLGHINLGFHRHESNQYLRFNLFVT